MKSLFSSRSQTRSPADSGDASTGQKKSTEKKKKFRYGLQQLAEGAVRPIVDIVFIHGLTGDREKTWTALDHTSPWPKSLLPDEIPNARILTFGYDADVTDLRNMVSMSTIGNHASDLIAKLATWRENDNDNERPIIFVCHSLGGLVCQDALSISQTSPEVYRQKIAQCTYGVLFLGTPHSGSGLAQWAEIFARSLNTIKQANSNILQVLKSDSEVLARIQNSFHALIRCRYQKNGRGIEITCCYEEVPLLGIGLVVPMQSAIISGYPTIGIHDNHMGMTKFADKEDPGFIAVTGQLRYWVRQIEILNVNHGFSNSADIVNGHSTRVPPENSQHRSLDLTPSLDARTQSSFKSTESVPMSRSLLIPSEINLGIMHILQRPLLFEAPSRTCLLYYGHVKGHPELVKVGRTTMNLNRVTSEIRQEQFQLHLPSIRSYEGDSHHIQRIESLVHMELQNERTRYRNNREILNVELGKVQHIIKRWISLFSSETEPTLYSHDGQLRKFWYDHIRKIADLEDIPLQYNLDSQIAHWDNLPISSC